MLWFLRYYRRPTEEEMINAQSETPNERPETPDVEPDEPEEPEEPEGDAKPEGEPGTSEG